MAWRCPDPDKRFDYLISELSELGIDNDSSIAPPKSVQKYYETIEQNKKASVLHVEEEPDVTYCISGRGRGGKRAYMAPGGYFSTTLYGKDSVACGNDVNEELRETIRATSGTNYASNEYIQQYIRAKQAENESKKQKREGTNNTMIKESPTASKSSSPVSKTECSQENTEDNIEYTNSSSSSAVESRDDTPIVSDLPVENVLDENKNIRNSKGAIPKKPLPLSEMLKKNKSKLAKTNVVDEPSESSLSPFASPFYPKSFSSTNGFSSDSSSSSSEYLSWRRRRSPSPVRDNWREGKVKRLDIKSARDFPMLKLILLQKSTVQLQAIAQPAPYVLKPFAGLYNPYPHGCSFLCNHPTNHEAREILRKAKDTWAHDGKNVLLQEEIEAIRANLQAHLHEIHSPKNTICIPQVESVPEELFRRYTDTDSRPLTPAPTLASAATRASGSRRCVTPDPIPANQIREKTLLVLDLRRSHSQETLSFYGSSSLQEPPLIKISHVPTRVGSLEEVKTEYTQHSVKSLHSLPVQSKRPKSGPKNKAQVVDSGAQGSKEKDEKKTDNAENDEQAEDEEFIKRRGKKRKKKGRDPSGGTSVFQASMDPETQVATIGADSRTASARPSLIPGNSSQEIPENIATKSSALKTSKSLDIDSYLDAEILKQLRRELNEEVVDNELNLKRRKALEEALKTISKDRIRCEGLISLQKELKLPSVNTNLWLSLPRTFTRSSARFELPMDSRTLSTMKPLDYVKEHISISSARKLLYNCVFNKFKMEADLENEFERKLSGKSLQESLDLMMGRPMTETQAAYFKELMAWEEEDVFDFKTFCGICALCERIFAPEYVPQLPDRKSDPCHEIETADFEVLTRKLSGQNVDERVVKILTGIKSF